MSTARGHGAYLYLTNSFPHIRMYLELDDGADTATIYVTHGDLMTPYVGTHEVMDIAIEMACIRTWEVLAPTHHIARWGVLAMSYDVLFLGVDDGDTDTTTAWNAAIAACPVGGSIFVPTPAVSYRLAGTVTINKSLTIYGYDAKIKADIPDASPATRLFSITADHVTIRGLWFDGAGHVGPPSGNRYCIMSTGTSGTRRHHIKVIDCKATNLNDGWFANPTTQPGALWVFHFTYFLYVDHTLVEGCDVDHISGSAAFRESCRYFKVLKNRFHNCGWYNVAVNSNNHYFEIAHNRFTANVANASDYGGQINIVGNMNEGGPDSHGDIHDNYHQGPSSYGGSGAIRCQSGQHIHIHDNIFDQVECPNVITVRRRGGYPGAGPGGSDVPPSEPPRWVSITNNHAIAWGLAQAFIKADGGEDTGLGGGTTAEGLYVESNTIRSVDANHYFSHMLMCHGQDGGYRDIRVINNSGAGNPINSGPLQGGFVRFSTNAATSPIKGIIATGNRLVYQDFAGDVGIDAQDVGFYFGRDCDEVTCRDNHLHNWFYAIRGLGPNTGPILDGFYDNYFRNTQGGRDVHLGAGVTTSVQRIAAEGITAGSHTGAVDVDLFRSAANKWASNDIIAAAGIQTVYKSGAGARITDADFPATPADGSIGVVRDTTTSETFIAVRANAGTWFHSLAI